MAGRAGGGDDDALVEALAGLLGDGLEALLAGSALDNALGGPGRSDGLAVARSPRPAADADSVTQPVDLVESLSAKERVATSPMGDSPSRAHRPPPEPPVLRTRTPATATVYSDTAVPAERETSSRPVTVPTTPAVGPVAPSLGPALACAPAVEGDDEERARVIVSRGGEAPRDPAAGLNEVTPTLVPTDKAGAARASVSDTVREQVAFIRAAVAAARDGDVDRAQGLLANANALGDQNADVYAAMAWTELFRPTQSVDARVEEASRLLGLAVAHTPSPWGDGLVRLCRERIAVLVSRTSPSKGE